MALRYAVATGNWSATATWDGGTLPTSADHVYANAFTVTIDTNVTVLSIRTTSSASPVIAAGGVFVLSDGITFTGTAAAGIVSGTTVCLTYAGTTSATINASFGGSNTLGNIVGLTVSGSGTLTVNGNVTSSTGSLSGSHGINVTSTGRNIVINGNLTGGTIGNASGYALVYTGTGTITVFGNVQGGNSTASTGTQASAIIVSSPSTNGAITVTGNVSGTTSPAGSSTGVMGIQTSTANASVTVIGDVYGGNTVSATVVGILTTGANAKVTVTGNVIAKTGHGITTSGVGSGVTVTGNVTGGSAGGNSQGIVTTGNGTAASRNNSIIGTVTASTALAGFGSHGIFDSNTSGGWTIVGGSLIDSSQGDCAVYTRRFRCIPTLNTVRQHANNTGYPSGGMVTYGSLDYIPNNIPSQSNVRLGTAYGNNSFTGTMAIPSPSQVAWGVPVDTTTGSAVLPFADLTAAIGSQLTAIGAL